MLTESMITLIGSHVPESGVRFTLLTVLMLYTTMFNISYQSSSLTTYSLLSVISAEFTINLDIFWTFFKYNLLVRYKVCIRMQVCIWHTCCKAIWLLIKNVLQQVHVNNKQLVSKQHQGPLSNMHCNLAKCKPIIELLYGPEYASMLLFHVIQYRYISNCGPTSII